MSLRSLGLAASDERMYRWVLAHPGQPLSAAAAGCELGRPEAEAARRALLDRGLVVEEPGTGRLTPVDPQDALGALARRGRAEALEQLSQLAEVGDEISRLAGTFRNGSGHHLIPVEVHSEPAVVREALAVLSRQTTESVRNMQRHPTPAPSVGRGLRLSEASLRRGVTSRSIYGPELFTVDHHVEAAQFTTALGSEVRSGPTPFDRLLIADGKVAVLSVPGDRTVSAIVVRDPTVLSLLVGVFDDCWERSHEVLSGRPVLTDRTLGLLRLMASGTTDEAAARELQVSTRQIRRDIAALMELTGTDSRFSLGVEASRRGWI